MSPKQAAMLAKTKSLGKDLADQMGRAQILLTASSLAYTTILSIIPLLAVSFAIFQAFGGLNKVYETIQPLILSNLAEGTGDEVMQRIKGFIDNAQGGVVGVGGLIGLIFTSMSMLQSAEKAINRSWGTQFNRGLFQQISTYWLFITLGPLALAVAVGAATSSNLPMARFLPSGAGVFAITVAIFFAIYKYVPHTRVQAKYAAISALITAALFNVAQWAFRLYTAKVVTYNKIYGSLGAVPILLLWIDIIWIILLSGAALNAVLQKRATARQQEAIQAAARPK